MNFFLKSFLLLTTLYVFVFSDIKASHIMGGELTYTYIGYDPVLDADLYRVCILFYRDDRGFVDCQPNETIYIYEDNNGDPLDTTGPLTLISSESIPQISSIILDPDLDACGLSIGFSIELCEYCDTIALPPSLLGFHIEYDNCCRNNAIDNLDNPGGTSMTFYAFIPPRYQQNNSASFVQFAIPVICAGDTTSFVNTAIDVDGDLLIYSFTTPYDDVPNPFSIPIDPVNYNLGYSVAEPFGPNGFININSANGLTFLTAPTAGNYVVAMEVREYRNNVLIGIVRRDLQFVVIDCPSNATPFLSQSGGSGQTIYQIEEGDSLCFPITVHDVEGDSLFMSHSELFNLFDNTLINPPATLTDVSGDSIIMTEFCWYTACGQGRSAPYVFNVAIRDLGCPRKTLNIAYSINVQEYGSIIEISGTDTICGDSVIEEYFVSGSPGSIFNWVITGGTILSGGASDTVTVLWGASTFGTVSVREVTGCNNDTITLNVLIGNVIAEAGNDTIICIGDSVQLNASGGDFYLWSTSDSLSDTTIADPYAKPSVTSTYYVFVSDSAGCRGIDSITIYVNPQVNINTNSVTLCIGDSATLTVSDTLSYTYWWAVEPLPNDTIDTLTFITVSPVDTTDYYVTASNGTCYSTDTITIYVNQIPVANAGTDTIMCKGDTLMLQATGGIIYNWLDSISLSDTSVFNPFAYPDTTTIYGVIVTNVPGGICIDTAYVKVTVRIPFLDAGSDTTICYGDTIQLQPVDSSGLSFIWSPDTNLSDVNIADPFAYPLTITTYTLSMIDVYGCTAFDSITINVIPDIFVNISSTTICAGDTIDIIASGTSFYAWALASTPNDTITTDSILTVSPSDTTIYILKSSDGNCTKTDTVIVFVNPSPGANIVNADDTICGGGGITIFANGNGIFLWAPYSGLSNPIAQNPIASPDTTTTYVVTVTANNGCEDKDSITIYVLPVPAVDAGQDLSVCEGDTIQLKETAGDAISWSWFPTTGILDSFNIQDPLISPVTTIQYEVTVFNAQNCSAQDYVTITVNSLPAISVSQDQRICKGDSVQIYVLGGVDYEWSPAAGLSDTTVSDPFAGPDDTTTYIVKGTDQYTCINYDTVTIVVVLPVNPNPNVTDTTICIGNSVSLDVPGGTIYSWTPSAGLNDSTISNPIATPLVTTQYLVIVSNDVCKDSTVEINIKVKNPVIASIDPSSSNVCFGDSINLTASGGGGQGALIYSWSPSYGLSDTTDSTTTATPLQTTQYSVIVSNGTCEDDTVQVILSVFDTINAKVNVADTIICKGDSVSLDAQGGTIYSWTPSTGLNNSTISNPIATPLVSTQYFVTVSNNVCKDSTVEVIINVKNPIFASIDPSSSNVCLGDSINLTASGGGGQGALTWSWSPSTGLSNTTDSATTATPLQTTQYSVIVSNGICENDTVQVTVSVFNPINASVNANFTGICPGDSVILTAAGGLLYNWSDSSYLSHPDSSVTNAFPDTTTTFTVIVTDGGVCEDTTLNITVLVYPLPTIQLVSDTIIFEGESVVLNAFGGVIYYWTPSTGLSITTGPSVTASPNSDITYYITGIDTNGCKNIDSAIVKVLIPFGEIFIPDAFTPNDDGLNDVLHILGSNVKEIQFVIYNRWGEKVFETQKNDLSEGWDGTFRGKKSNTAVFFYYVKGSFKDDKPIDMKGDITLIR